MLPAASTPRAQLLRLGWWPAWAILGISVVLHLLSGDFPRLQ